MYEEQAVSEQLTFSELKKRSFKTLLPHNNEQQ